MIICPKCKKEVGNLLIHYRCKHDKTVKSKLDFYKLYPEFTGKSLQIPYIVENKHLKCPYCFQEYKHNQALQAHIHGSHPNKFISSVQKPKLEFTCPICQKKLNNIREHANLTHNLEWKDFCEQYSWDESKGFYITDKHRENLSKNKRDFYQNTERGKELREIQSILSSTNNPSKDPKVKEKIMHSRALSTKIPNAGFRGIKVSFNGMTFRSFNEFNFYVKCKQHNIELEFEPSQFIVKWFNPEKNFLTSYLPDFYEPSTNTVIELKSSKHDIELAKNDIKYKTVKPIYDKLCINYVISTYKDFLK